jgi:hypothetical protein
MKNMTKILYLYIESRPSQKLVDSQSPVFLPVIDDEVELAYLFKKALNQINGVQGGHVSDSLSFGCNSCAITMYSLLIHVFSNIFSLLLLCHNTI